MEPYTVNISHMENSVRVLGPGNRSVIWTQGCCFDCPGCIAQGYRTQPGTQMDIQDIAQWHWQSHCNGLTISGGEPMLQADGLKHLIELIRSRQGYEHTDVICYSGFTYEEIMEHEEYKDFLSVVDVLIDGRYMQELDDDRAYVGSSNQRIICLNERMKPMVDKYYAPKDRCVEMRMEGRQLHLIGVPSKRMAEIWLNLKKILGRNLQEGML